MTALHEQITSVLRCEPAMERPLFMPAIYEHKAFFIDDTPSNIARDADLLARAVLAEYATLEPDALAIGVDVYNLEAEAAGCRVLYYEGDDTSIPGISPGDHAAGIGDDFTNHQVPNPLTDGRMPVNIAATRQVVRELGDDIWVRGAVSGPFSLALNLVGTDFFMCCITDPDQVKRILRYCTDIIKTFGLAYIDVGADVILFDSAASPDMLSPKMFADFVQPCLTELVEYFKGQGVDDVPLIIGGNTTRIIDPLIQTGANNLLCDFTADWEAWSGQCRRHKRALRRNIDPGFLQRATPAEVFDLSREIIAAGADLPGFIMGTAVVPYGTPTDNLLAVRGACYQGWPSA